MNETNTKAINYFQSYQNYFWQWETDYMFNSGVIESADIYKGGINCISIPDGMTIAYKEQIKEVLTALSFNDLPPFGALILVFLATNSGEVGVAIDELFEKFKKQFTDDLTYKHIHFEDARHFLKNLISLPAQYKKGKNRIDLFAFLFHEVNHSLSTKYTPEILTCIKNDEFQLNASNIKVEITRSALGKDFNSLAVLHGRYPTVGALLKAWGNSVEVPIEPEDTEIESYTSDPDFIQELLEDPKTFYMGSLIKRLWSGINLPLHYAHPGEMPLGGISDITNKGNFDNLLVSEFANDDIIFLHRIANNEALFIRRETMPEEDLRTRIFLIDTSIKNWGTPKILSFATAYSFIHHPKNEMNFQCFAIGNGYKTIQFDAKINIIEGLQITSPLLDASSAIEQFINESEEENIEITLFTSPKTLEHQSMQRIFNIHHDKFGGVITADINGNIDVYKMKNGTKRLAKHIQLPLEELWVNPPRKRHQNLSRPSGNFYAKEIINYPILYGFPARSIVNFSDKHYAYALQKNGDIFRTNDSSKGFEMIYTDILFVSGIKQQMLATLFQGELMTLYWNSLHQMVFKTAKVRYIFKEDLSRFEKVTFKDLVVYNDEIYIVTQKYYSDDPVYTKFDIHDKIYEEITTPTEALKWQYKDYLDNQIVYFEGSIFTKIYSITITENLDVIFNKKHKLEYYDGNIFLKLINESEIDTENEYTILFHKRNLTIDLANGCKITIDKNGVLIFESSVEGISTFYLSSYIGVELGIATDEKFAGNRYFLHDDSDLDIITMYEFRINYIEPFLKNILNS